MKKPQTEISLLKRLIDYVILTILPVLAASLAVYLATGSMAILALMLYQGLNLFVFFFSFFSLRIIEKSTVIKFPYGTGKLENFSSFFLGALSVPACLYIIVAGIGKLIHPNINIAFGLTQLLLVLILARAVFITWYARRVNRAVNSPMSLAYYENFRTGVLFFTGAFIALFAAWLLVRMGYPAPASYIDPALAIVSMSLMLLVSVKQVVRNYRVLIDLPLPEDEQVKVITALAGEFAAYDNIGRIFTRASGKHRFIDVELFFDPTASNESINQVRARMESRLRQSFPDLTFNLIALCSQPNKDQAVQ